MQRLALVGPFEGFGHRTIVIFDESQDLAFQVLHRSEIAAFEHFSNQDAEPNLDLVHPGSMFGGVMKDNAMGGIAQKSSSGSLGFQNTRFALHPQIDRQVGFCCDIAHQRCRQVRVEIVTDKVPFSCQRVGSYPALDMLHKILFIASLVGGAGHQDAVGHVKVAGKRQRTMPLVFKLTPFDFPRQ